MNRLDRHFARAKNALGRCEWRTEDERRQSWSRETPPDYVESVRNAYAKLTEKLIRKASQPVALEEAQRLLEMTAIKSEMDDLRLQVAKVRTQQHADRVQDVDIAAVAEQYGFSAAFPVILKMTSDTFGKKPKLSVEQDWGSPFPQIVISLNVGKDANVDGMIDLQARWHATLSNIAPEAMGHVCLILNYR